MEKGWDIIISGGSGTRSVSLTRAELRFLLAGVIALVVIVLSGMGFGIWGVLVLTQNSDLRKKNAELEKRMAIVSELEKELSEMRETNQRLRYMLGMDTLSLVPSEPMPSSALPPTAGSRSENTVPQGLPVSGPITQRFSLEHGGIDIAARIGTPVVATAMGLVERVGQDTILGLSVEIAHPSGYRTIYGHLSRALVRQGQQIYGGDIIGYVGETGKVTGPHLHYGIMKDGVFIDPMSQ
ncbi:MAG: peptidoglycan DD-metalloendopeptidase family protein [candidate division WOR-3 bacterium]